MCVADSQLANMLYSSKALTVLYIKVVQICKLCAGLFCKFAAFFDWSVIDIFYFVNFFSWGCCDWLLVGFCYWSVFALCGWLETIVIYNLEVVASVILSAKSTKKGADALCGCATATDNAADIFRVYFEA